MNSLTLAFGLAALVLTSQVHGQAAQNPPYLTPGAAPGEVDVNWLSVSDRTYFLQFSLDLTLWHFAPYIEYGDGDILSLTVSDDTDGAIFYRLLYTDAPTTNPDLEDFDGDGLGSLEEIMAGHGNPLVFDTDADGTPDYDPATLNDPTADTDQDGVANGEDAVPYDTKLTWAPTPESRYAILRLPLDGTGQPFQKLGGVFLNNHGRLAFRKMNAPGSSDSVLCTWKLGDATVTEKVIASPDGAWPVGLSDGSANGASATVVYTKYYDEESETWAVRKLHRWVIGSTDTAVDPPEFLPPPGFPEAGNYLFWDEMDGAVAVNGAGEVFSEAYRARTEHGGSDSPWSWSFRHGLILTGNSWVGWRSSQWWEGAGDNPLGDEPPFIDFFIPEGANTYFSGFRAISRGGKVFGLQTDFDPGSSPEITDDTYSDIPYWGTSNGSAQPSLTSATVGALISQNDWQPDTEVPHVPGQYRAPFRPGNLSMTSGSFVFRKAAGAWDKTLARTWSGNTMDLPAPISLASLGAQYLPFLINNRGEVLHEGSGGLPRIWRNGKSTVLADLLNDPDEGGLFLESINDKGLIAARLSNVPVLLLPIEVVELSPKLRDADNNEIAGSEVPKNLPESNSMVEEAPNTNRIAHREMKVKVGSALKDKKITWTMDAKFTPEGQSQPSFRGDWARAAAAHRDRFETSSAYGAHAYRRISQEQAETTVDAEGFTAIRVNVPPIGFNKARIKIQIEGTATPIELIDLDVQAVVVIDPGHGGTPETDFPSASWNNSTSPSGVLEKTMALSYGQELKTSLETHAQAQRLNLMVLMTRTADVSVSGQRRARWALDYGADQLFIIHFNASNAHTARGTLEVRQDPNLAGSLPEDIEFIDAVLDRMVPAMQPYDAACNRRAHVVKDTTVATDTYMGNEANYHPVRAGYCEVEFIDFGAQTPNDRTDDAVDILLNTGPNAGAVKTAIANAMRDGIIQDLRTQPRPTP